MTTNSAEPFAVKTVTCQLHPWNLPLPNELMTMITSKMDDWNDIPLADKKQLSDACEILRKCETESTDAVASVMTVIARRDPQVGCVKYVLENWEKDKYAASAFVKMAASSPILFMPHIDKLSTTLQTGDSHQHIHTVHMVARSTIDLLLALFDYCKSLEIKKKISDVLNIAFCWKSCVIDDTQIVSILEYFKCASKAKDLQVRRFAWENFVTFSDKCKEQIVQFNHASEVFEQFLQMLSKDELVWDQHAWESLKRYCSELGGSIIPHLPILMNRLLATIAPDMKDCLFQDVIGVISAISKAASSKPLKPFHAQMKQKVRAYLMEASTETHTSFAKWDWQELVIDSEFMRLFIGVAVDIVNETIDCDELAYFYNLFGQSEGMKTTDFLPKIVPKLLSSIQMDQSNRIRSKRSNHAVKLYAIEALKRFAIDTGEAFGPYMGCSFEAVWNQLYHSDESICNESIRALIAFLETSFKANELERTQQFAVRIIPRFANMLKKDKCEFHKGMAIIRAYAVFMKISPELSEVNTDLFNEIFSCIEDILM